MSLFRAHKRGSKMHFVSQRLANGIWEKTVCCHPSCHGSQTSPHKQTNTMRRRVMRVNAVSIIYTLITSVNFFPSPGMLKRPQVERQTTPFRAEWKRAIMTPLGHPASGYKWNEGQWHNKTKISPRQTALFFQRKRRRAASRAKDHSYDLSHFATTQAVVLFFEADVPPWDSFFWTEGTLEHPSPLQIKLGALLPSRPFNLVPTKPLTSPKTPLLHWSLLAMHCLSQGTSTPVFTWFWSSPDLVINVCNHPKWQHDCVLCVRPS